MNGFPEAKMRDGAVGRSGMRFADISVKGNICILGYWRGQKTVTRNTHGAQGTCVFFQGCGMSGQTNDTREL